MRAGNQAGRGRRLALYIVAALAAVVVLGTSLGLMGYIDQKLKQGAEQQVVTFTQQAASNVTDRIFIVQNAIGAFEVQSADPAAVVPALQGLRDRFGFAEVAFSDKDGRGVLSDGTPFSVEEMAQPETALSQGQGLVFLHVRAGRRPSCAPGATSPLPRWAADRRAVRADSPVPVLHGRAAGHVRRPRLLHAVPGNHR